MGASVCERAIDLQPMHERTTSNSRKQRTRAAASRSGLTRSASAVRRASLKAQLNPQSRIRPSQSSSVACIASVQPERDRFIAEHGNNAIFHFHAIQAWSVSANGEVQHVYA